MRFVLLVLSLLLLVPPATALAQEAQEGPTLLVLEQRNQELVDWLDAYKHWEAWTLKWGNKIAFNAAGGMVKDRPVRPEPPEWLWQDCRELISADGRFGEACAILARWNELYDLTLAGKAVSTTVKTDVPKKTSFLHRVHLSGGWVPAQMPAPKVYLVAGMQVGVVELGRVTLPAVGVGLVAMSDGMGDYEWKPATVFGIGYRLTSFAFPGINRPANLHINIARVTIHGVNRIPIGLDANQHLMGFSLTFGNPR
jgi:hypothetical protein